MLEEWLPLVGFEKLYEISSFGNVRSIKTGIFRRLSLDRYGYMFVVLSKNNKPKNGWIARIVMEAFYGPSQLDVNHIDGNKLNNCLTNLEYVTKKQNIQHAFATGLLVRKFGLANKQSKLDEHQVRIVRRLLADNCMPRMIADCFGVSRSVIAKIAQGNIYKEVK